jgi:hypothetical protein
MALTTESRTLLIAALTGNGYKVYDNVPAVPDNPERVHRPGLAVDPAEPDRLHPQLRVRWRILVNVNARVNDSATTTTEDAIDTLLAQIPSTFQVDVVNAPQLLSLGAQGTVVSTEINVSISQ